MAWKKNLLIAGVSAQSGLRQRNPQRDSRTDDVQVCFDSEFDGASRCQAWENWICFGSECEFKKSCPTKFWELVGDESCSFFPDCRVIGARNTRIPEQECVAGSACMMSNFKYMCVANNGRPCIGLGCGTGDDDKICMKNIADCSFPDDDCTSGYTCPTGSSCSNVSSKINLCKADAAAGRECQGRQCQDGLCYGRDCTFDYPDCRGVVACDTGTHCEAGTDGKHTCVPTKTCEKGSCPKGSKCDDSGLSKITCNAMPDYVCLGDGCETGCTEGGTCEFIYGKCLNDCWEFDTEDLKCKMKKDDSSCYNLDCQYDSMNLDFDSKLFGVEDNQSPNPFADQPGTFSFSDGRWRSSCDIGACEMSLETREIDDVEHLVFGYKLVVTQKEIKLNGRDIFLKNPILKAEVLFECAYRSEVKINSDAFNVHSVDTEGEAIEFGDLDQGFNITIYVDPEYETPVDDGNVFIGEPLYPCIDWQVDSLKDVTKFLVDECKIVMENGKTIDLIDDNCYATTFGVEQLTPEKIVDEKAHFKFNSFIVGEGSKKMTYQLQCGVKICPRVEEEKCKKEITKTDAECPTDKPDFAFKANTYSEKDDSKTE